METQDPEKGSVEGQTVVGTFTRTENAFTLGTLDNFTILIDRYHLAVLGGVASRDVDFTTPEAERQWINWQLAFHRHLMERLERYAELRLAQLDENAAALIESAYGAANPTTKDQP